MIRLLRRVGSLEPGDETGMFSPAEEAALARSGVAEPVAPPPDLQAMTRRELEALAAERGVEVPARATKAEIAGALGEAS